MHKINKKLTYILIFSIHLIIFSYQYVYAETNSNPLAFSAIKGVITATVVCLLLLCVRGVIKLIIKLLRLINHKLTR